MIFIDTETCGLHGMAVLIQWAEDDGEIHLHEVWQESAQSTMDLIEWFCTKELCFFNATFDWFHLSKLYLTLSLLEDKDVWPEELVEEMAYCEEQARDVDLCLKPKACVDLMLYVKKGPFQSLMDRHDIKIKRVPTTIAEFLKNELNKLIQLDPIYFARKKVAEEQWQVDNTLLPNGDINPLFKNVTLRFAPSTALKTLTTYVLKKEATKFAEIELNKRYRPKELGYAPYALATGTPDDWKWAWPQVIKYHIEHWSYNSEAREYAKNDIVYTRELYHFLEKPEPDNDSALACSVASTRWRGFKVNVAQLRRLRDKAQAAIKFPMAPNDVKRYLAVPNLESTDSKTLNEISKWMKSCDNCIEGFVITPDVNCGDCGGTGMALDMSDCHCVTKTPCPDCTGQRHEAAAKADNVISARKAKKEIELFDKLILAGRFHASFKVIGALSGRMSGADGLNPQAIKATTEVRSCFPLAFGNELLCGGDFSAMEVGITAAICKDQNLIDDLTVPVDCCDDTNCPACGGRGSFLKKIHGLFAEALYPDMTYNEILATAHTEDDRYLKGKASVFARIYFGEPETISNNAGISLEHAEKACKLFDKRYPGIEGFRNDIIKRFSSMSQPNGIGTAIFWKDSEEYSSSLLGYRRYFTLENEIQSKLFKLAQSPPRAWRAFRVKVTRRDRVQTASGAAQSALYGAAFAIESSRIRQAGNHIIQSTGATITKAVQAAIWELQPSGINNWKVRMLNVHDEVLVAHSGIADEIESVMSAEVEKFVPVVPLLKMDWSTSLETWSDK